MKLSKLSSNLCSIWFLWLTDSTQRVEFEHNSFQFVFLFSELNSISVTRLRGKKCLFCISISNVANRCLFYVSNQGITYIGILQKPSTEVLITCIMFLMYGKIYSSIFSIESYVSLCLFLLHFIHLVYAVSMLILCVCALFFLFLFHSSIRFFSFLLCHLLSKRINIGILYRSLLCVACYIIQFTSIIFIRSFEMWLKYWFFFGNSLKVLFYLFFFYFFELTLNKLFCSKLWLHK